MDLSWIAGLMPAQTAALVTGAVFILGGIAALLVLARHLGLSVSKNGLSFRTSEKTDAILETVKAIKESDERQERQVECLVDEVNKNTKDILRLTFYNELLSPANRLVAGKRYLAAGGNGETEKDIRDLAAVYPDVWQGILAVGESYER
jgi:hypothetical protein